MRAFFPLTALALVVAACGADPAPSGEPCTRHSDCSDPTHLCLDGVCRTECGDDRDCEEGELCIEGRCLVSSLGSGTCTGPDCAGPPLPCLDDTDCPFEQPCNQATGTCARVSGAPHTARCDEDGDCSAGKVCRGGTCEPGCTRDEDCASGRVCRSGACETECTSDDDCEVGRVCRGQTCQAECSRDADCAAGRVCRDSRCEEEPVKLPNDPPVVETPPPQTEENPYSGRFRISSTQPIQRCNDYLLLQFDSRVVDAEQKGKAYTFTFPESTYHGQVSMGSFSLSWSGLQGAHPLCGDFNTANVYTATFQGTDFFAGTLRMDAYFPLSSCNCTLIYPITGTRM